jgi:peroxiredoxin
VTCSRFRLVLAGLALICVAGVADAAEKAPAIGRRVDTFTLQDFRGKAWSFDDAKQSKFVVVAFLGTECPLAKLYGPRLVELAAKYEPRGVAIVGVNSNSQDSVTELAAYARLHKIDFPLLKDPGNKVADAFGAERTPEVFVFDAGRIVRYHGRIDDQYGVGSIRNQPRRRDLAAALDELLAGQPVSQPTTEVVGCHIGRAKSPKPEATVTYSNQIARLLQKRCVECHRDGDIAPFALTEYDEVAGWAEMIAEVVREQRMPPWHADPKHGHFKNERLLSADEKQLIFDWVAAGAPQGDPKQAPPQRQFTSGWTLPREPDVVIPVQSKPFRVPPTGEVRYQYFTVDPKFTEDKWLAAAELQPGNRAVVHHILTFARQGGRREGPDEGGVQGFLVGYVPGMRAEPFPAGMAKRVSAGSQLIFQVHYTPIGSEQFDQSKLGLVFANPQDLTHEVRTTSAANVRIRIPPNADNHWEEGFTRRPLGDSLLLGLMPHMHLRGKSFFYEALLPDGTKETLVDIPRYDFNWQTSYRLAEPKPLPAGTRIHAVAHYDNSDRNLSNPDPTQTVRWGDQTWEEMLIGYFDIAIPIDQARRDAAAAAADPEAPESPAARAKQIVKRFDTNNDGVLLRTEVPEILRRTFDRLDRDADGKLTEDEIEKSLGRLPDRN